MGLEFTIAVIGGLFAIVNPLGNIPVYVAITEGYTPEQKARVRNKVCVVMAVVLVVFALVGRFIFELYGITIPAFKIAGGILLFSIALSMVRGQMSRTKITNEEHEEASEKEEVGVVPLGVPLFVGPGAITTTMIYVSLAMESDEILFDMTSVFLAIAITVVLSYLMLYYADPIFGRMGKSGSSAFTRIMGLLLAALAIEFIISGSFTAIEEYWNIHPVP
jgi:multiple antibiotic resistance protein